MKIQINREALEKKLQILASVIPTRSMIPVLDEGLIEVSEEGITITTSDQNITISSNIMCEIKDPTTKFDFVCDVRTILGTISLLKSETITLYVTDSDVTLSTPRTRKKYQVPIQHSPEDFPQSRSDKWGASLRVPGKMFSSMISKASVIIEPNSLMRSLTGINMLTDEGSLIIQGATTQRCCVTTFTPPEGEEFKYIDDVIIPRSISNVSSSYEKSANIEISIDEQKRNLMVKDGVTTTLVRLIDAKYPSIKQLLTAYQPDISVKLLRLDLTMSVKRLSSYINKTDFGVMIDMTDEEMKVHGGDTDFKKEAEEFIPMEEKSSEMGFVSKFNYKFFGAMLPTFAGDNVYFSQTGPKKPGFFTDDSYEGFSTVWLVSPMLINNSK